MLLNIQTSKQKKAATPHVMAADQLIVCCLCAQWCRTCQQYEQDFALLSQRYPEHLFLIVDADFEDFDLDIDNFPTILIQYRGYTLFFGTMMPMISQLERLLETLTIPPTEYTDDPADLRQLWNNS